MDLRPKRSRLTACAAFSAAWLQKSAQAKCLPRPSSTPAVAKSCAASANNPNAPCTSPSVCVPLRGAPIELSSSSSSLLKSPGAGEGETDGTGWSRLTPSTSSRFNASRSFSSELESAELPVCLCDMLRDPCLPDYVGTSIVPGYLIPSSTRNGVSIWNACAFQTPCLYYSWQRSMSTVVGHWQTFGDTGCHPERSEGSGSPDAEILRFAQDDRPDHSQVRSREVFSPNVCIMSRFSSRACSRVHCTILLRGKLNIPFRP